MKLSPHLTFDGRLYGCNLCGIYGFFTLDQIHDHCRYLHHWCERCRQPFVSAATKAAHLRDSSAHNFCEECDLDLETDEELEQHDVDQHYFCPDCNLFLESEEDLEEHNLCPECETFFDCTTELDEHDVECHNFCIECGDYLPTENDLRMHRQTYEPRDSLCYSEPDG